MDDGLVENRSRTEITLLRPELRMINFADLVADSFKMLTCEITQSLLALQS